jgi:flavin-dependent dehydrogenase
MAQTIAIIGGGPAGANAAARLAAAGRRVILLEAQPAWEKPCGGGLTSRALARYPFLRDATGVHNRIAVCEIISPARRRVRFELDRPIAIYSRQCLNGALLERARSAGAEVIRDRVQGVERSGDGWELRLRGGTLHADFAVVAAGSRSPLRAQFSKAFGAGDLLATVGYFAAGTSDTLQVCFLPGLAGYIWLFPRADHYSAGICGKLAAGVTGGSDTRTLPAAEATCASAAGPQSANTAALRGELERHLDREGIAWRGQPVFAHVLPSPSRDLLMNSALAGPGWALVGDAAGMVDPITGEGIYYALRSGDILAEALLANRPGEYAARVRAEIAAELAIAADIADRFFFGRFAGAPILERMVQFTRASRRFRALMRDLFAGEQSYSTLRRRVYRDLVPSAAEILFRTARTAGATAGL